MPIGPSPLHKLLRSAVLLLERGRGVDAEVLVAWNEHYCGWTLPGGKVEPGEDLVDCLRREVREETGIILGKPGGVIGCDYIPVYEAESASGSGILVTVFRVERLGVPANLLGGEPRQRECGRPVGWLRKKQFLECSVFAPFHRAMFEKIEKA